MRKIKSSIFCLSVIISVVCFSLNLLADEGVDDPDFDYLPPEEIGIFDQIKEYTFSWFKSASHAGSFTTAKRRLYNEIGDKQSLYCSCKMDLAKRTLDRASCNYTPANDNNRAKRIEAEHVLPAFWIAKFHTGQSCWVKDEQTCGGARECCLKNDERFKKAHNDLINLAPAIGELNADRSNLIYNIVEEEPRLYGACDFETDRERKITEPKNDIRGDIARIYFYMRDTYELKYPDNLSNMLDQWNITDPVSDPEKERNTRIEEIQGTSNPYVK